MHTLVQQRRDHRGNAHDSSLEERNRQATQLVEGRPRGGALLKSPENSGGSPGAESLLQMRVMLNQSSRAHTLTQMQRASAGSPRVAAQADMSKALNSRARASLPEHVMQRRENLLEEELLQETSQPVQKSELTAEQSPRPAQPEPTQQSANRTGLPDALKAGVENLSGLSMNDVKVHYNSAAPAQMKALAYTQGTNIYVGPGQQQHVPHEAWHVVQQKQGRVRPTLQAKGVPVNDDRTLEHEADVMGMRAFRMHRAEESPSQNSPGLKVSGANPAQLRCAACAMEEEKVQRKVSAGTTIQMVACQGTAHDTSNEHRVIEIDYTNQINPNADREYEIPQGSLDTYDNGTHKVGYSDIADRGARELYEIKRHNEAYPQAQLNRYLQQANANCGGGWTAGSYYPSERIIDFSNYEPNTEIIARKDARPGFIRYEKRQQGGGLGILNAFGGGVYVGGMAAAANLPPTAQWVKIWTEHLWDSAEQPEAIDPESVAYQTAIQQIQQRVQNVQRSLRGGTLDRDLLLNGWNGIRGYIDTLHF